jgi:hypothetical protein
MPVKFEHLLNNNHVYISAIPDPFAISETHEFWEFFALILIAYHNGKYSNILSTFLTK